MVTDNILQVNLEGNFILLFKIVGDVTWLVLNYFKSKLIKVKKKFCSRSCTFGLRNILRTCEVGITAVGRF